VPPRQCLQRDSPLDIHARADLTVLVRLSHSVSRQVLTINFFTPPLQGRPVHHGEYTIAAGLR
jgi:hypothetical protein